MTVNTLEQPGFLQFLAAIWLVWHGRWDAASVVVPFTALAIPANPEVGWWWRLKRQRGTVSAVTSADGGQPRNRCAFSGDVSILRLPWSY